MHSREQKAALERLAADLRRIRTQADKTLNEIHEDTRVPLEVLRRLESDLLAGDEMFNDVYLRSILRGYARAVQHSEPQILDAFEQASNGSYSGGLLPKESDKKKSNSENKKKNRGRKPSSPESDDDTSPNDHKASKPGDRSAVARDDKSVDSDAEEEGKSRGLKGFVLPKFDFRKGGIGILVLAAVATGIYGVNRVLSPDVGTVGSQSEEGSAISSSIIPGAPGGARVDEPGATQDPDEIARQEPFVMPDTVEVSITTVSGVFDPIRVRIDRDLRRPYWADEGDTLTFSFTNRIIFEEQADRVKLYVRGQQYPLSSNRTSFTLTRDLVEEFLTPPS